MGVDGITASVSRTVSLVPDEAAVSALVATDLGITPQQAAGALQAAGVPAPSLVAVTAQSVDYGYPSDGSPTQLYFQFSFAVPAADLNAVNQKLEALRNAKPDPIRSLRCQSDLRASRAAAGDARKRAGTLVSAAGLSLGALVAVNDASYAAYAAQTSLAIGIAGGTAGSSTGDGGGGLQMTYTLFVKFASN